MKPQFKENKATEAAAYFLKLQGSKMPHLKLMKLLYLAERAALLKLGHPITFDSCVSMPFGPVLSMTLNLIHGDVELSGYWNKAITPPTNHEVELLDDPGDDNLSEAEIEIINCVFKEHGTKDQWELKEFTHTLEEWQDPKGSAIKIEYKEILKAGGMTESEIESILEDIETLALMDSYTGH